MAVASPSISGLVATMTSLTPSSPKRLTSSLIFYPRGRYCRSGKYAVQHVIKARNSWVFSIAITSFGLSTTQMTNGPGPARRTAGILLPWKDSGTRCRYAPFLGFPDGVRRKRCLLLGHGHNKKPDAGPF
jgi:hypothetical protein